MKKDSRKIVPFFQFNSFPVSGRLDHAVFTRRGGQSPAPFKSLNLSESVTDFKRNVMANRSKAYSIYERTNNSLVHAHLTHGREVAQVTSDNYGQYVGPVDALISDQRGCGLTMNYADCSPILLYDPINKAVGLGHAGWKGAVRDLPGAMAAAMERNFGTKPDDLMAGIGPSIGSCCYEIGKDVIEAVQDSFDDWEDLLLPGSSLKKGQNEDNHAFFNLSRANRRNLENAGVKQIEVSDLCTSCRTDLFFSHRAEGGLTGRFGALLILN